MKFRKKGTNTYLHPMDKAVANRMLEDTERYEFVAEPKESTAKAPKKSKSEPKESTAEPANDSGD